MFWDRMGEVVARLVPVLSAPAVHLKWSASHAVTSTSIITKRNNRGLSGASLDKGPERWRTCSGDDRLCGPPWELGERGTLSVQPGASCSSRLIGSSWAWDAWTELLVQAATEGPRLRPSTLAYSSERQTGS